MLRIKLFMRLILPSISKPKIEMSLFNNFKF